MYKNQIIIKKIFKTMPYCPKLFDAIIRYNLSQRKVQIKNKNKISVKV